jgi:hypothetical protein
MALIPLSLAGLALDPRLITGAPAWLKPLKFALSTTLYVFTLAWVFTFLGEWPRMRRVVGWATSAAMLIELAIIDGQALRGTTSHFNTATPLDMALFFTMGLVIVAQTLISIAVAVALWRQPFADPALGWALRLGMVLTIAGASTGMLMTRPTAVQLADARLTHHLPISGAHTVGAPDGGPGLPLTGWSTRHGDVRVPHFVALHAWQALPLFAIVALPRGRLTDRRRTLIVGGAAAAYALVFLALLLQALSGRPFLSL